MITELKLITRNKVEGYNFEFSNMDIEFDNRGFLKTCNSDEGLNQNFMKAVITANQSDGYGTNLYKLLGKPNITYIKVKLMQEILTTMYVLREAQLGLYNDSNGNFDSGQIVNKVANLYFKDVSPTSIFIDVKVQSLKKSIENSKNLNEINITV